MSYMMFAQAGGLFAVLLFVHFVVDWVFQTHYEAMKKNYDWKARAIHCFVYATGFVPILVLLDLSVWELISAWSFLWWSHFVEDTYIPVVWWMRHVRRIPQIRQAAGKDCQICDRPHVIKHRGKGHSVSKADDKACIRIAVMNYCKENPLGLILMIAIDQIIHSIFLWPVVWMVMN